MKKNRIALCIGGADIEYQSIMLKAIAQRCRQSNTELAVFSTTTNKYNGDREDVGAYYIYNLINYYKFDGVIIVPQAIKDKSAVESVIRCAHSAGLPVVSIDSEYENCYCISKTDENAIEQITDHFIEKHGFTEINYIGGIPGIDVSISRENAYRRSLEKHGIKVDEDRISCGNFTGFLAATEIEKYYMQTQKMPQAIVCANDAMAVDVVRKIIALGFKVPDDVCVSGLDGIRIALANFPAITTAKFDYDLMGTVATDRMLEILDGKLAPTGNEIIESTIIYNASCGCRAQEVYSTNDFIRKLYLRIEANDYFSEWVIDMIEKITCSVSFDEALSHISEYFCELVFGNKTWMCLCDDYTSELTNFEKSGENFSENKSGSGYTRIMQPVIVKTKDRNYNLSEFNVNDMLPDFENEIQEYNSIIFLPLHFLDKTIGYTAIAFDEKIEDVNFHIINSLLMNISMAMENSHIQNNLKSLVKQLSDLYIHDSMTGLYNRRGFYSHLSGTCSDCLANGKSVMFISIDLDGMKYINDIYGHNEGDNAIITLSKAISFASTSGEVAARFGGDEFVVAAQITYEDQTKAFLDNVRSFLDLYNRTSRKPYQVEVSMGFFVAEPDNDVGVDEFIRLADERMYEEKKSHKNARRNNDRI